MSKYRDQVIEKIAEYLYSKTLKDIWEFSSPETQKLIKQSFIYFVQNMLNSIPELAIVNRSEKYPEPSVSLDDAGKSLTNYNARLQQFEGMRVMETNGWVKEIKQ